MSKQNVHPWHRKLYAYTLGAAIWMGLLGMLYVYPLLTAPHELRQERLGGPSSQASHTLVPQRSQ